jgi:hypothetical protein
LLRFGALRGVRQQERSIYPLQRPVKRWRVIEIALGRGYARLAGDAFARVAWTQQYGELDASGNQRVREQRADHSGGAADEQTGRHGGTSARDQGKSPAR